MIKFITPILISLFLIASVATPTKAQEPEFDYARAYQDYVFTQDTYNSALSDYRLARSQYLQARTLVSQSKAREATVKMLEARDDVVISYLIAIRMRIIETDGINSTVASGLTDRLDAEISWYRDHKSRISSAGDLSDLVSDSDVASKKFLFTRNLVYESLLTISDGKVNTLRDQLSTLISDTRNKTFEIEANDDFDLGLVQRWLSEAELKVTRSLDKSIEAQTQTQALYEERDATKLYNSIVGKYFEAYQLLVEGNNFLKEIVRELT